MEPETGGVSRRQFLTGIGMVGAAGALAPGLLSDPAEAAGDDGHAAVQKGAFTLTLRVNGSLRQARVEPRTTLLNALRNHLDPPLTGPKLVCDRGTCGACTVLVDHKPVYACMMLAADAVDRDVVTVEGLQSKDGTLHAVQQAFVDHDALMCGFCTPGFVMSVKALLDRHPHPTREQVQQACAGNVCRCGTYPRVIEAALAAAARRKGGA